MQIKKLIRSIPGFPKKGIVYRDITPLLLDPEAMKFCTTQFIKNLPSAEKIDKVIGIEARGFFFATLLAEKLNAGLVPVRKAGKLPYDSYQASYSLEYGKDMLEIHQDAILPGENVLIHDDVLATGGTALATAELVKKCGGNIVQFNFLLELEELNAKEKLKEYDCYSLMQF